MTDIDEKIGWHGSLALYEYPSRWTNEEFRYWMCPEIDHAGHVLRPARVSEDWMRQHLAMPPVRNLITNTGIALLLANASVAGQGNMNPFAQILSVGNVAISGVTRADTSVSGDGFATGSRKAPTSYSIVGLQTTIIFNFANADAVGTWTNAGLYCYNTSSPQAATTTAGTGALATHAVFAFTKSNSASYAVNYSFSLSN